MASSTPIPLDLRDRLARWRDEVLDHRGSAPDDDVARLAVVEAIDAGLEGNAAVGAVLVDRGGNVVRSDHNRMFAPYFRSDRHAEMVLLNGYEDEHPDADVRDLTLVTSLEPCEMCNIRIINSGVGRVLWVAPDLPKGAINGPNRLADHWARLAEAQVFAAARCDARLSEVALAAFEATIGGVTARLRARRNAPGEAGGAG